MAKLPLLALAACLMAASSLAESNELFSFQTGIDMGSSYAGGLTYDKTNHRLFLTGGTYARGFFVPESRGFDFDGKVNSDCFFVSIRLANETQTSTEWDQPTRLGYVKDPEACSTAHFISNHDRLFLGASASGESMGRTDVEGDVLPQLADVSLFGEVISVSLAHLYQTAPVLPQHYIFGGHGFYQSEVNYPFAITSKPQIKNSTGEIDDDDVRDEPIYVASLYSKYGGKWSHESDQDEVDLTTPYVRGNVWGIAIQKINVNPSDATNTLSILESPTHMEREWMKNYQTTDFQKLQATDMVFVNGNLLLAGSTYDFAEQFAGEDRTQRDYQDYDGFLVKLDPETGDIATSGNPLEKMKMRIQSEGESDDIIEGICLHPADERGHVPYVYVVGKQHGHIHDNMDHPHYNGERTVDTNDIDTNEDKGGGFVMKIDMITMEIVWKDMVLGPTIEAVDCAVTDDGQLLYVAGNVKNGGVIPNWGEESKGKDDVWIRQYTVEEGPSDGIAMWQLQLGSDEDESLAKGGALTVDSNNQAILYGNTKGSMGRVRAEDLERPDATNDLFIMSISTEGVYLAPNPNPVFQIPRYYFGKSGTRHHVLIVSMFFVAVILFCVVMCCGTKWKPVDLWYYSRFSDIFDRNSRRSAEGKALNDMSETGFSQSGNSESLPDSVFVTGKSAGRHHDPCLEDRFVI